MIPTKHELRAFLTAIGPDPAAVCRERGIKGKMLDCHECPVAVLVAQRFGLDPETVWVGDDDVFVTDGTFPVVKVVLPRPLCKFVEAYDNDGYPDLVVEGKR